MSYLLLDIKCELREGSESVLFISVSLVHDAELECSRMSSLCDKINKYQYFEAVCKEPGLLQRLPGAW